MTDPLKRHEYVALLQQEETETQFEDEEPPTSEPSDVNEAISQEISQQRALPDIDMPDGMVFIPAGDFQMGSEDIDAFKDEKTGTYSLHRFILYGSVSCNKCTI